MGRQNARLWHDGKDHKDLWKLIDDEDTPSGKYWRMHWKIYKGNKLLWKKLPPDFLLLGAGLYETTQRVYESVTGKNFTNLGFLKSYTSIKYLNILKLCKAGKYLFAKTYDAILYTDNYYSWKKLNTESLDLSDNNWVVTIENYNERLLIYSAYKIAIYDCETGRINIIYESANRMLPTTLYQLDSVVACVGDTAIAATSIDGVYNRRGLLIFKSDKIVKTFEKETRINSVAKNGNGFWVIGKWPMTGMGGKITLLHSEDGMIWNNAADYNYAYENVFTLNDEIFLADDDGGIGRYSNGEIVRIENNVGANLKPNIGRYGFFMISAKNYIYANSLDGNLIRFKNFDDDTYEVLIEDYGAIAGIYAENWED